MPDFLDTLAQTARKNIDKGYYEDITEVSVVSSSLEQSIVQSKTAAIITEVKGASPSKGTIRSNFAPEEIAKAMVRGGATGISVLTEPSHFQGSLSYLAKIREAVNLPILMKDIIISRTQLDAAAQVGANAVLLILALFDRGYSESDVPHMIAEAHARNLEVLLETHTRDEFNRASMTDSDLVGVNNRDLRTLRVDLNVTRDVLANQVSNGKIVVSESGINSRSDVMFLRDCGAKAFLVGSAVMVAVDVEAKVRELAQGSETKK